MRGSSTTVFSFGSSEFGQISQTNDSKFPIIVQLSDISSIRAGGWQSAAISADGELYLWGLIRNIDTDLVVNMKESMKKKFLTSPVLALSNIVSVGFCESSIFVLNKKGLLTSISDSQINLEYIQDAIDITCRYNTMIVRCPDKYYVLTHENNWKSEPKSLPESQVPESCVLWKHGYCILSNTGDLHVFTTETSYIISDTVSVAATNDKLAILKPNGRIYEVLRNGSQVQIRGINSNPVRLFAGGSHFGCVTFEGECWTWGYGMRGQLGSGGYEISAVPKKVPIKAGLRVTAVSAGEEHTLVLAVRTEAFVPTIPERMRSNNYMKMVRMDAAIVGAFVASEFDSKF